MKVLKSSYIFLLILLTSCGVVKAIKEPNLTSDSWRDIKRDDIKDALLDLDKKNYVVNDAVYDTEMNISKLLTTPPPPPIGNGELISFSITEEVPLKDVLIELGRLADIDMQIDPKIGGGIILKITEKPINVVIDKICDLANLKYEYDDGILKIERDLPYTVNYQMDILVDHALWTDIETSIQYILDIFPVKQQESINTVGDMTLTGNTNNVSTLVDDNTQNEQRININKAANIISVYANSKAHKAIAAYLEQAKKTYASQVLIEAKVVEVKLNDSYQAGINWTLTEDTGQTTTDETTGETVPVLNTLLSIVGASGSTSGLISGTINHNFKNSDKSLNVVIDAMQKFGDTKTLSSPRISTLNNQKATLDFINTVVYFSIEKEEDGEDEFGATKYTYSSTKQEEEVGVKLEITPTIDLKKNEVTLTVRPELSSVVGYVEDPVNEGNRVPQIQKRTLETSLKIASGDIMVIGGLMSENMSNSSTGIPFLMNIPILGHLFKMRNDSKELTETVIFIKATIVNSDTSMERKDRQILNNFKRD